MCIRDRVKACVEKAGTQIITLALRRANEGGLANILDLSLIHISSSITASSNRVFFRGNFTIVMLMITQ